MNNTVEILAGVADQLQYRVYHDSKALGIAAAEFVSETLKRTLRKKDQAHLILATGASQFEFLEALKKTDGINWSRITVFHLDEYIGLDEQHPASFRRYLRERILDAVKPAQIHFIAGDGEDINGEIELYTQHLGAIDIDLACIGIGENGHIAFNDPPVADFDDPSWVKIVELDHACRMQQVGEGWFNGLPDVPTHALTLTIPAIMRSKTISCVVPDARKAEAVRKTLTGPVSTMCPASILRTHGDCWLWLDRESGEFGKRGSGEK